MKRARSARGTNHGSHATSNLRPFISRGGAFAMIVAMKRALGAPDYGHGADTAHARNNQSHTLRR